MEKSCPITFIILTFLWSVFLSSAFAKDRVVVVPLHAQAGATASGADKQMLYNDGGSIAGADMYYDKSTKRVGVGVSNPTQKLSVKGRGTFDLGTGTVDISTPGGWPGIIFKSSNGHRREMAVKDNGLYLAVSDTDAAPDVNNGIWIFENGKVKLKVLQLTGGSDLAEGFDISPVMGGVEPEPGMIVSIDPSNPGSLIVSDKSYDRRVAGIISGAGGVNPGMTMGQNGSMADGAYPIALTGRAYCRADASNGPIAAGDLLTTSDTSGYAMKVTDFERAKGAILGKAMTPLQEGKGLVLALVTLQ